MSTPKPFVSDERINDARAMFKKLKALSYDEYVAEFFAEGHTQSSVWMRSLYEPHVQQLVRERDDALGKVSEFQALANEVVKVWNEDGEFGEIQKKTPIAWYRVLRLAESLTTHKTPPSNG